MGVPDGPPVVVSPSVVSNDCSSASLIGVVKTGSGLVVDAPGSVVATIKSDFL